MEGAHNIYLTSHQESTLLFVHVLKDGVGEVVFFSVLSIVLEIQENVGYVSSRGDKLYCCQ